MRKDLPMELLRTYVTVFDLGSFTRAAEALGRTQPAISLQMRRLEEIVDAKLITNVGRKLKLTEDGEFFTGIPHMEPSQPVECDSKPLDVQFAFE